MTKVRSSLMPSSSKPNVRSRSTVSRTFGRRSSQLGFEGALKRGKRSGQSEKPTLIIPVETIQNAKGTANRSHGRLSKRTAW